MPKSARAELTQGLQQQILLERHKLYRTKIKREPQPTTMAHVRIEKLYHNNQIFNV